MDATRRLLDRARARMKGKDLIPFVAFDPGVAGYATAFDAIVERGEQALTSDHDGQALFESFDFTETVGLVRWGRPHDDDERWFRVLTGAAHLAARPLGEEDLPLNYTLVTLLGDSLVLSAALAGDAPIDLLPEVFREARESVLRGEGDAFAKEEDEAFCVLAELLVLGTVDSSATAGSSAAEALRARLVELDALSREECNRPSASEAFVWGLTVFDQLHADWVDLVVERFPTISPAMAQTRARLIEAGAKWREGPRRDRGLVADKQPEGHRPPTTPPARLSAQDQARLINLLIERLAKKKTAALPDCDALFTLDPIPGRESRHFAPWLAAMNNALATGIGTMDRQQAARWADVARPFARDNQYLPHNLACAYAMVGRNDEAFEMCQIAVEIGYASLGQLERDEDLGPLRDEPRFKALFRRKSPPPAERIIPPPEGAYTVQRADITPHEVPPLLDRFAYWLGYQLRGSLGWVDGITLEPVPPSWDAELAPRLHEQGFVFLTLADGSLVCLLALDDRPSPVILLDSEGDCRTLAPSLETFLVRWSGRTTGLPDLDDEATEPLARVAPAHPAMKRWLAGEGVTAKRREPTFDLDAYFGRLPHVQEGDHAPQIEKDALLRAAERCKDTILSLPTEEDGYRAIPEMIEEFPGDVEAYYASLDSPEGGVKGTGATKFGFALLLADALGARAKPTEVEGDFTSPDGVIYTVFCGDLHVKGNLAFNGVLVVLGDLVVDGSLRDWHEGSSLWVTGTVRAKAAHVGASVWVGKSFQATLVLLSRWAALYAHEGTVAQVALRNDYDGEGFLGHVAATHQLDVETNSNAVREALLPDLVGREMELDECQLIEATLNDDPITR